MVLPLGAIEGARSGTRAVLGVRPEHIAVADESDPSGAPVEVVVVEPMGSETQVVAKHGATEIVCLFRNRFMPKPGDTIRIKPNETLVHLFDAERGTRIN